jgi:hypothetical protein
MDVELRRRGISAVLGHLLLRRRSAGRALAFTRLGPPAAALQGERVVKSTVVVAVLLGLASFGVEAQAPYIVGTWQLNVAASRLPGPPPQMHVRRYSMLDDGTLVGLAVFVDPRGTPGFLQFAAKPDGKDYAEYDSQALAAFQAQGITSRRTYSETPIDSHTVEWADKLEGRVIASGKKWVSADGRTLSFTQRAKNANGEETEFLFVFDRQ